MRFWGAAWGRARLGRKRRFGVPLAVSPLMRVPQRPLWVFQRPSGAGVFQRLCVGRAAGSTLWRTALSMPWVGSLTVGPDKPDKWPAGRATGPPFFGFGPRPAGRGPSALPHPPVEPKS